MLGCTALGLRTRTAMWHQTPVIDKRKASANDATGNKSIIATDVWNCIPSSSISRHCSQQYRNTKLCRYYSRSLKSSAHARCKGRCSAYRPVQCILDKLRSTWDSKDSTADSSPRGSTSDIQSNVHGIRKNVLSLEYAAMLSVILVVVVRTPHLTIVRCWVRDVDTRTWTGTWIVHTVERCPRGLSGRVFTGEYSKEAYIDVWTSRATMGRQYYYCRIARCPMGSRGRAVEWNIKWLYCKQFHKMHNM